ncbi:unnamed protein product [Pieris macdunnoughi]|uniref:Carboxylic ester hydrolase n=1 Tax=Pieris macdunnoughi TaxID=345717 RepID=A0A821VTZ4_9NEOP|nr:unnamed protein product [Pieris macdunnoughi]
MLSRWMFLLWASSALCELRLDPLVDTKQGLIKGLRADDGDYSMFLGIPYGRVDTENPFGESKPYPKFETAFEAYDDSAICPQVEEFNNTIVGNLDCLHLNVYVPHSATSRNKLPVLVWIYGGGFRIGFAGRYLYGPKYLVRHDVILVTLNYRLGPYGFMCLDLPEVPGNQGLKDQALALKWVKENIEEFGGNSNKITIFGESAGAASVEFHLLSNQEKLYHQAILHSGSVFGTWVFKESDNTVPSKIAKQLGFETNNVYEALDFLKTVDEKLVIAASTELSLYQHPCVEKEFENVDRFIHTHPINIDVVAKAKGMPILTGFNSQEELMAYATLPDKDYEKLNPFDDILSLVFDMDQLKGLDLVRHFYIGDDKITSDVKWDLINFNSDIRFNYGITRSLERFLKNGANVYNYLFSYEGGRNFVKRRFNVTEGEAAHADELGYLFDVSFFDVMSEDDQLVIDRMTTMWTNFVKYGNPTPEVTDLLPVSWPAVTKDSHNYFNIDKELTTGNRPFTHRMSFWELFYTLNEKAIKGYVDKV